MRQLFLALQFLTIVPVKVNGMVTGKDMSGSAVFFPVVGALQGLFFVLSAALLSRFFSADITSCLVLVILIITNGGFHLDGLADTFDAMAVKACGDEEADREKRLSVMKDSTTGAIGAIAIVIAVLLKYLLVKNIFLYSSSITLYSLLFLMPVFSKWIMVPAMYLGTSARKDGLGRMFIDAVTKKDVVFASVITGLFSTVYCGNAAIYNLCVFSGFFVHFFVFCPLQFLCYSIKICKKKIRRTYRRYLRSDK